MSFLATGDIFLTQRQTLIRNNAVQGRIPMEKRGEYCAGDLSWKVMDLRGWSGTGVALQLQLNNKGAEDASKTKELQ